MLHQISLRVEDRARAVAFYRDIVRLPLLGEFPNLTFFDLGAGCRLLIGGPGEAAAYIGVPDIQAAHAKLQATGVEFLDQPHHVHTHDGNLGQPAGTEERMAFFRDSEGNLIALSERRPPTG